MNVQSIGKNILPKTRKLLIASAVVTGGLLTASLFKTPKPADNATPQEIIEYYTNNETVKEPGVYEWNSKQSVASNVVKNAKVTSEHIMKATDSATDHPAPLSAALALELMGVGLAGAGIKRNRRIEEQKAALEKVSAKKLEANELRKAEEAKKNREIEELRKAEEAKKSELESIKLPYHGNFYHDIYLENFGVDVRNTKPFKKVSRYDGYKEFYRNKDGFVVEAGIQYANVPNGVNEEDYTYRYVRLLHPRVEGKKTEIGSIHYLDEKGHAVEVHVEKELTSIETEFHADGNFQRDGFEPLGFEHGKNIKIKREYKNITNWCGTRSEKPVRYFPEYEQQNRTKIIKNFLGSQLGYFTWSTPKINPNRPLELK